MHLSLAPFSRIIFMVCIFMDLSFMVGTFVQAAFFRVGTIFTNFIYGLVCIYVHLSFKVGTFVHPWVLLCNVHSWLAPFSRVLFMVCIFKHLSFMVGTFAT